MYIPLSERILGEVCRSLELPLAPFALLSRAPVSDETLDVADDFGRILLYVRIGPRRAVPRLPEVEPLVFGSVTAEERPIEKVQQLLHIRPLVWHDLHEERDASDIDSRC